MAQKIDLTVIVVSYNTKRLTLECLDSLFANSKGLSLEVIVVDNNSNDGSRDALKSRRDIKFIANSDNKGFAGGNNQAVKIAKGKFILLLNSDTKITSDFLQTALDWMENNPHVGVYSCALKNSDGTLQATGGYFPTLSRIFTWMFFIDDLPIISDLISSYHPKISFYKNSRSLDWVTGAFFLTRAELWKNTGLLDEKYFMYVEEVDLCWRALRHGWKVFYDPNNFIIHYGGASSTSSFPIISEFKSLRVFYKKHFGSVQLLILRLLLKLGALMRVLIFGILKGPRFAKIYAEAFIVS